jgi:hypothetical protein
LGHDFVLCRNIRIANARDDIAATPFVQSTYGSHHIHLADYVAKQWNTLLKKQKDATHLQSLPELWLVQSKETFGLVASRHLESFGGLLEPANRGDEDTDQIYSCDLIDTEELLHELSIDPVLCLMPLATTNSSKEISNVLDPEVSDVPISTLSYILNACQKLEDGSTDVTEGTVTAAINVGKDTNLIVMDSDLAISEPNTQPLSVRPNSKRRLVEPASRVDQVSVAKRPRTQGVS